MIQMSIKFDSKILQGNIIVVFGTNKTLQYIYDEEQIIWFDKTAFIKKKNRRMKIKAVKQKTLSIQLKFKPHRNWDTIFTFFFFFFRWNKKFIEKDVKKMEWDFSVKCSGIRK